MIDCGPCFSYLPVLNPISDESFVFMINHNQSGIHQNSRFRDFWGINSLFMGFSKGAKLGFRIQITGVALSGIKE